MRYVQIHRGRDGNTLDPSAYLDVLPELAEQLPTGARAFASDPQHYDFFARRCVKNLTPARLTLGDTDGSPWADLVLEHNCCKHDENLIAHAAHSDYGS